MSLTLAAEGPTLPCPAPGHLLAKVLGRLAPSGCAFLAEARSVRKLATAGDPLGGRDACYGARQLAALRWPCGCACAAFPEHVHSFFIARQVFKEPFRAYRRPRRSGLRLVPWGFARLAPLYGCDLLALVAGRAIAGCPSAAVGGAEGVRTPDPRLAKPMLSQLSYSPGGLFPFALAVLADLGAAGRAWTVARWRWAWSELN